MYSDCIGRYGYVVPGSSNYAWTNTSVKNAIDNYGPALFSFAGGYYYNHTVAVFGYKTYRSSSGDMFMFFAVQDGWVRGTRYVAGIGAGSYVVACLTTIKAP